jgi:cytochrome c oxidase subunit 2
MLPLALTGCRDVQSALAPNGPEAERIATLSWALFIGAALIFIGVLVLTLVVVRAPRRIRQALEGERLVVWGGIVFPSVTLAAVLAYGFVVTRAGAVNDQAPGDPVRIHVAGELWWWRVTYTDAEGRRIESANELRIPVGRRVEVRLTSDNVIHSFWVPNLAGKLDMIPGRTTTLTLTASTPGVSRGQCAEYCGGPHALMAFYVVAMPPDEFEAWLQHAGGPAAEPASLQLKQGQQLFLSSGCGACHAIRNTSANGRIGPDLTHVASRLSIAAATMPTTQAALARWTTHSQEVKPDNKMPPFDVFGADELAALSAYLASLR